MHKFSDNITERVNDLITVGIPFFNPGEHLFICLNSVIQQTHKNIEILLIDDGSTDNSLNSIKKLIEDDDRIKLIADGSNLGLIARLNQIIEIAQGDYIARMDADDIMLPQRLEKQLSCFKENPDFEIVTSAAFTIDQNNNPIGFRKNFIPSKNSLECLLKKNLIIHPSILVKTSWYRNNFYDPEYYRAEDLELWCRTVQDVKIYPLAEPLIIYREGNVNVDNYNSTLKTLRKIYTNYGKKVFSPAIVTIYIFITYIKWVIYRLFEIFNRQHFLTLIRNEKLGSKEKERLSLFIATLKVDRAD